MALLMLDPEAVLTFILVSEHKSFTKAAHALNTTQSAVSMRLRRLEEELGVLLVERSTRSLKLSSPGQAFIQPARDFLSAHDRAMGVFETHRPQLSIGISHHLVGLDVSQVLASIARENPGLIVNLTVDGSQALFARYEQGEMDAIILMKHASGRRHGEKIGVARFGWFGAPDFESGTREEIPIVIYPEGCSMRNMVINSLGDANVQWREAFIATSATNLRAAILAGFGVGALSINVTENALLDLGDTFGLPRLPSRDIMLLSQVGSRQAQRGIETIKGAISDLSNS